MWALTTEEPGPQDAGQDGPEGPPVRQQARPSHFTGERAPASDGEGSLNPSTRSWGVGPCGEGGLGSLSGNQKKDEFSELPQGERTKQYRRI